MFLLMSHLLLYLYVQNKNYLFFKTVFLVYCVYMYILFARFVMNYV